MTDIIKAVLHGIVEGFTEFLPISSTGHLIILNHFIGFSDAFARMFDVVIQLGAILAVVVYFWKRLVPFGSSKTPEEQSATWMLWKKTIVAVIPAILIGAVVGKYQEKLFDPKVVAGALLIGGILLLWIEQRMGTPKITSIRDLSFRTAFFIGIIQCLSMIPGTSRSAATIIGAMLLGSSRLVAVEFSFFLAIPTMVAATGYSILKSGLHMTSSEVLITSTGFIVSFFVAWLVIAMFMKFISKRNFKPFGYYRIVLALLIIAYFSFTS
jgi:undecaprenyl-diphosphatase